MSTSRLGQIEIMLKSEPDDSFLNYALALEYGKLNNVKKAIEIIEKLLINDENYLGAYYQLGKYYEQAQNYERAKSTFTKGMSIAKKQNNNKAIGELFQALIMLE